MAITVEKLSFCEDVIAENSIHSLPFKIHFDGEANVSDYFKPQCSDENAGTNAMSASFRGFPLDGVTVKIPEQFHGFILAEKNETQPRKLCCVNKFNSISYWNWDRKPSKNDAFLSALDWIDFSQQVHDPVEDETVH